MSKICTDLEQSRKLVELGLDTTTADMYFEPSVGFRTEPSEIKVGDIKYAHPRSVPAWSLSALLELMPLEIYDKQYSNKMPGSFRTFEFVVNTNLRQINRYKIGYHLVSVREFGKYLKECGGNTLLDAAFEMVVWLLEKGYIKAIK